MNRQRPLLLILLVVYIFAPTLYSWIVEAGGQWYRPFVIWLFLIVIAYLVQARGKSE